MKAAVTGASGFLGRQIVARLAAEGVTVLAVSRQVWSGVAGVERRIVTDYLDTPGADVLVHLAEGNSLQSAHSQGESHLTQSVGRLRALCNSGRFGRVVYASSAAVYGDASPLPHRPDERLEPLTIYARAKLECERVVLGARGSALRLGNIIGPGMSRDTALGRILEQVPGSGALSVRDDSAVRDFLWEGDLAVCVAGFVRRAVPGVFNVGSGDSVSVRQLAQATLAAAGESHRAVVSESRPAQLSQLRLDISATCAAIDWKPRVKLDAALAEILKSTRV